MVLWRNNFLLWGFYVFMLYFIWKIFSNKYFQKWGFWKKYKKRLDCKKAVLRKGCFKASTRYEFITMLFYYCFCLIYCLFFMKPLKEWTFWLVQNLKASFVSQPWWSTRRASRIFRTEWVSKNKASSRNISATMKKQKPSWGKFCFFIS